MPEQLSLYDPVIARTARDLALGQVLENASLDWAARAIAAVRNTCDERSEFIVDDVWREFSRLSGSFAEEGTHERRAMGAVMVAAARLGWCQKTDRYLPSDRKTCHRNPRVVWRSLRSCSRERPNSDGAGGIR